MRKSLASGVGVAAAFIVMSGAGSAEASPYGPYVGSTYGDASGSITSNGGTAVIVTREGSYLPTEKCIVVGSRKSGTKFLLDLNCNDIYAGESGHPGNSAVTPEGQAAKTTLNTAKYLNENYAKETAAGSGKSYCEENTDSCTRFCQGKGAGLCSAELMQFLGL